MTTRRCEIPGYRVDLEREVDLIEEVVRVQGYDRVGSTLPAVRQPGGLPETYAFRRRVRDSLVRAGLREVWLFPFASDADLELTGDPDAIRVTNPLSRTMGGSGRGSPRAPEGDPAQRLPTGAWHRAVRGEQRLPYGRRRSAGAPQVGIALTGAVERAWNGRREFDFFDAKGVVEALMADLGIAWTLGEPVGGRPFHPGRSGFVLVDGSRSGSSARSTHGWRSRSTSRAGSPWRSSRCRAHAARGDDRGSPRRAAVPTGAARSRVRARRAVAHASVEAAIREAAGELVATCVLFDVHSGPPLPDGKKSLAFSVDFRAPAGP